MFLTCVQVLYYKQNQMVEIALMPKKRLVNFDIAKVVFRTTRNEIQYATGV